MPETWFTSDLHLGHEKVAALRGFDSPTDHDVTVMKNWRKLISEDDIVYVLGDISSGGAQATRHALTLLSCLPGRKRLIAGNHDPIHPMYRQAHKWVEDFDYVFEQVTPFQRIRIDGHDVMLSHFPYILDRHEARYMQYRLRDEGLPLIHGHLHVPERLTSTREVHIGLDAWNLRPVRAHDVARLLEA